MCLVYAFELCFSLSLSFLHFGPLSLSLSGVASCVSHFVLDATSALSVEYILADLIISDILGRCMSLLITRTKRTMVTPMTESNVKPNNIHRSKCKPFGGKSGSLKL